MGNPQNRKKMNEFRGQGTLRGWESGTFGNCPQKSPLLCFNNLKYHRQEETDPKIINQTLKYVINKKSLFFRQSS